MAISVTLLVCKRCRGEGISPSLCISIANVNPKPTVSPQPYEFNELHKRGPIPGVPHMTTREDLGGINLRICVLGRGPETSPFCRGPGAPTSLTYLLGPRGSSLHFCIRKLNNHRAEKQVSSIISTTGQWMSLLHHRNRISTPRGP